MRIPLISILILVTSLHLLNAQAWKEKFYDSKINVNDLRIEFNQYWSEPGIDRNHRDYKNYARLLEKMKRRTSADGRLMKQMSIKERQKINRKNSAQHQGLSNAWTQLGPKFSPTHPGVNFTGVGRMTTIDWHQDQANKLLAGAASGGVWISEDLGQSWFSPTDQLANLGIYDIQIDPNNPEIVYAATGDFWSHVSTYGLIKSINGGLTWEITGLIPEEFQYFTRIWKILVNPTNSNLLTASTSHGVYNSINGGQNWFQSNPFGFRHMIYHPVNPNIIYAATGKVHSPIDIPDYGFYISYDKGTTWQITHIPNIDHLNVRLDVIASEPSNVYILTTGNQNGAEINVLYKSTDNGMTYDSISTIPQAYLFTQRNINWTLSVDPSNPSDIYVGSLNMVKSEDGGLTWGYATSCTYNDLCVHVDYHQTKFFGNSLFIANDGGIYSTDDSGATWNEHNNGLETTQYYRHSNSETNRDFVLGGSQDNGTHMYDLGWTTILGADGMDNEIDPTNEDNIYFSYQRGSFFRSTDRGNTIEPMININITGISGSWTTPMELDPTNPSTLYVGYDKIWKSTDSGLTWTDFNRTPNCTYSCVENIVVAPSNPDYIYYNEEFNFMRSTDGGLTSEVRSSKWPNWIEVSPTNENHLWIVHSSSIEESFDGGQSWININHNLTGNLNFTCIAYDEGTNDHLYVGSFQGVYFKDATMDHWLSFSNQLPNVEITELDVVENFNIIRASTYGRGIWETYTVEHEGCLDTIEVKNVINSGIYHASKKLESSGVAFSNKDVQFKAGEEIELNSDFEVKGAATFQAYIENCMSYVPNAVPLGYKCDKSVSILNNGQIYSSGPDKGNGGTTLSRHAIWYSYIPMESGLLSIESCGHNTNLKIWRGGCDNLELLAESQNDCTTYQEGSSILSFNIPSGQKIYLEWDSYFEIGPFDFSFSFVAS